MTEFRPVRKEAMRTISAEQVKSWNGRIIDVRSLGEFGAERLPGTECVPLGALEAAAKSWKPDEPLLLMCRSGVRSRQACDQLVAAGFTNLSMLAGGIEACKKAGLSVIVVRRTLPIIRQVLIVAGSLLIAGLALAGLHPVFLLLAWLVSLGLVFAGVTGYCPMAKLLEMMPWNRSPECKDACGCKGAVQKG